MNTVLITGASRGIGLEFTRQYAGMGWNVLACCRNINTATGLTQMAQQNDRITLYSLDVRDRAAIDKLATELSGTVIDVLIANAGIYGDSRGHGFGNLDYQAWMNTLETNVLGAVKVAEAFYPHLKRGKQPVIAALSSQMGSIADNGSGGSILYRSSKAALNAAMKSIAIDVRADGVGVLIFHPGWVKTDMGGPGALIDAQISVAGMIEQIKQFDLSRSGQFIKYDGSMLPW